MSRVMRAGIVGLTMLSILVLTACGGESDGGGGAPVAAIRSPTALVADTFGDKGVVKSGKLTLSVKVDAKGSSSLKGPLSLSVQGPFALGNKGSVPKFDLDLAVDTGAMKVSAGAISTGDKLWVKYAGQAFAVPSSAIGQLKSAYEKAEKGNAGKAKTPTLASLGIDPRTWLEHPEIVGDETVGGDKTTHVRADVDVAKLIGDVDALSKKTGALNGSTTLGATAPTLSAKDRDDIERALKSATVDLWTGSDDHILRRLRVAVSFDVPADARSRAGGLTDGSLLFDVAISDLDEPQAIAAPANARPFSELQPLLSGLLSA